MLTILYLALEYSSFPALDFWLKWAPQLELNLIIDEYARKSVVFACSNMKIVLECVERLILCI